ncbi:hypothetical protein SAMN06265367_10146 [Algoriphagus winogradskyi]|uniref:Transposase n=1 Tax=Algoriphagus winogradskyi TaxID=237017 RepID=A0ABY1N6L9_9BACT|nr:hypothetical protein SAMN06265367_10146 [Algoriphagus winogradskyi]
MHIGKNSKKNDPIEGQLKIDLMYFLINGFDR